MIQIAWEAAKLFFAANRFSVLLYGGIALGGVVLFSWWSIHQYNKGWTAAIIEIAQENERAVNAANEARSKVRACYNSGGTWDQSGGVCR